MKIATDLEQSKKLAEFLPNESADMFWLVTRKPKLHVRDDEQLSNYDRWEHYPAWSLSALMSVLPHKITFENNPYLFEICTDVIDSGEKYFDIGYRGYTWLEYETSKDLVDAYYRLIIKLHEIGVL